MAELLWRHAACARSGQVELELDESVSEPTAYALTIKFPSVQLRFAIPDRTTTAALSQFLHGHSNQTVFAELQIGILNGVPVRVIKDSEHFDRFFMRAASEGMIDIEIVNPVTGDFVRAAKELAVEAAAL